MTVRSKSCCVDMIKRNDEVESVCRRYKQQKHGYRNNNNNNNSMSIKDEIPSEVICPITMSIMEYPVMSRHGQNYERSAILDWIAAGNETCPLTRQSLTLCDLVRNRSLEVKLMEWKEATIDDTSIGNDDDDNDHGSNDLENEYERRVCFFIPPSTLRQSEQASVWQGQRNRTTESSSPSQLPATGSRTTYNINRNGNNNNNAVTTAAGKGKIRRGPMKLLAQRLRRLRVKKKGADKDNTIFVDSTGR